MRSRLRSGLRWRPGAIIQTDDNQWRAAGHDDGARRWITLGIVVMAAFIVALDNSVLNVAIPTILRELDTDLLSLQWVLTGYSLTFATFLVIGGRLADIFGARRMFIIGAALFGIGLVHRLDRHTRCRCSCSARRSSKASARR